jgi:hypothetical protein
MIIALPATGHDHLADALVRDLGFTRAHVDDGVRALLLELDPIVTAGVTMANQGFSPKLSAKLEQYGGWERLLNPPRSGSQPDRVAAEVKRLLEVLRTHELVKANVSGDTVVVGVETVTAGDRQRYTNTESGGSGIQFVALADRFLDEGAGVNHWIDPAGVIGEQAAIVDYVQQCRTPRPVQVVHEFTPGDHLMSVPGVTPTVEQFEEALRKPLDEPMFEAPLSEAEYLADAEAKRAELDEPADDALATALNLIENAHE